MIDFRQLFQGRFARSTTASSPFVFIHRLDKILKQLVANESSLMVAGRFQSTFVDILRGVFKRDASVDLMRETLTILLLSDQTKSQMSRLWASTRVQFRLAINDWDRVPVIRDALLESFAAFNRFISYLPEGPSKIKKQIKKIGNDGVESAVVDYFLNLDGHFRHSYQPVDEDLIAQLWSDDMMQTLASSRKLVGKLIANDSIIMDMYGIPRAIASRSILKLSFIGDAHYERWMEFFHSLPDVTDVIEQSQPEDQKMETEAKIMYLSPDLKARFDPWLIP